MILRILGLILVGSSLASAAPVTCLGFLGPERLLCNARDTVELPATENCVLARDGLVNAAYSIRNVRGPVYDGKGSGVRISFEGSQGRRVFWSCVKF